MSTPVSQLLETKRVLVCCGAGGVGKTTVSASLALAAARRGRRVLVVTIDPSKRLAETLGVDRNPPEPIDLPDDVARKAGITGRLSAWMLDPQMVSDQVVQTFSNSKEQAEQLLQNPIYRNVTAMVAGMQEYTAVEALHGFVKEDRYDLVILDTPPSRDALRFLDAPDRAGAFLDRRIFNLFVAAQGGVIGRMATRLIEMVMDIAFGEKTRRELQDFFALFGTLLGNLNQNQAEMRAFFREPGTGFILVTSPDEEALNEAKFFYRKASVDLEMEVCGYILNRSLASYADRMSPDVSLLGAQPDPALVEAMNTLLPLAHDEAESVAEHAALLDRLSKQLESGFAFALPHLGHQASQIDGLVNLANVLVGRPHAEQHPQRQTPNS